MITQTEYQTMMTRTLINRGQFTKQEPVECEADLHDEIIQLCKDRGYYYVHSRTDRRTTQACGVPDFIVAIEAGKTLFLECKARNNKPTVEQLSAVAHLNKLGHTAAIVTNMAEVMAELQRTKNETE